MRSNARIDRLGLARCRRRSRRRLTDDRIRGGFVRRGNAWESGGLRLRALRDVDSWCSSSAGCAPSSCEVVAATISSANGAEDSSPNDSGSCIGCAIARDSTGSVRAADGGSSCASGAPEASAVGSTSGAAEGASAAPSAIGSSSIAAAGIVSTAAGIVSTAAGIASTAAGIASTAVGIASTAVGIASTAVGVASTAAGVVSTAAGVASTAAGVASTAAGVVSTAAGVVSDTDSPQGSGASSSSPAGCDSAPDASSRKSAGSRPGILAGLAGRATRGCAPCAIGPPWLTWSLRATCPTRPVCAASRCFSRRRSAFRSLRDFLRGFRSSRCSTESSCDSASGSASVLASTSSELSTPATRLSSSKVSPTASGLAFAWLEPPSSLVASSAPSLWPDEPACVSAIRVSAA